MSEGCRPRGFAIAALLGCGFLVFGVICALAWRRARSEYEASVHAIETIVDPLVETARARISGELEAKYSNNPAIVGWVKRKAEAWNRSDMQYAYLMGDTTGDSVPLGQVLCQEMSCNIERHIVRPALPADLHPPERLGEGSRESWLIVTVSLKRHGRTGFPGVTVVVDVGPDPNSDGLGTAVREALSAAGYAPVFGP